MRASVVNNIKHFISLKVFCEGKSYGVRYLDQMVHPVIMNTENERRN